MERRNPGCGSELPHGPHEYTRRHQPDGTPDPGSRDHPARWCAGWTAEEAGLCDLIRQVRAAIPDIPDGQGAFRLECHRDVAAGLRQLFLGRLGDLAGAELTVISGWPPGRWRLAVNPPDLASGTIPSDPPC